jgi:hypothetical protein
LQGFKRRCEAIADELDMEILEKTLIDVLMNFEKERS